VRPETSSHAPSDRARTGPAAHSVRPADGHRRTDRTGPRDLGHHLRRHHGTAPARTSVVRRNAARPARRAARAGDHPCAPPRGLVVEGRRARRAQHRCSVPLVVRGGRATSRRCRRHSRGHPATDGRRAGRRTAPRPPDGLATDLGRTGRARRRTRRTGPAGPAGRRRDRRRPRRYGHHGRGHRPHQAVGPSHGGRPDDPGRLATDSGRPAPAPAHRHAGGGATAHRRRSRRRVPVARQRGWTDRLHA
jgi:hypothetical protein